MNTLDSTLEGLERALERGAVVQGVSRAQLERYVEENRDVLERRVQRALAEQRAKKLIWKPRLEEAELDGSRLAFAFNLNKCVRAKHPAPDEPCYSVRAKPRSGSRVLGYIRRVLLHDVIYWVDRRSRQRILDKGAREVCCYVVGTVVDSASARGADALGTDGWSALGFNPFKQGCFFDRSTDVCLRSSRWCELREDNTFSAFDLEYGEPYGPNRPNPKKTPDEKIGLLTQVYDVENPTQWADRPLALDVLMAELGFP